MQLHGRITKRRLEGVLTFMRLNKSASKRTNLFVFFLTILGRVAGRSFDAEPTILHTTHAWS